VIEVIAGGLQSTLQDGGRFGCRASGIGTAGAMDRWSARVANAVLGNADDAPVLEMALSGPELLVRKASWCAICGADFGATISGETLPMQRPVWLPVASRLRFRAPRDGCRAYLAVASGFVADCVFGSASTDLRAGIGGFRGRALRRGDRLRYRSPAMAMPRKVSWSTTIAAWHEPCEEPLALIPGPTLQLLSAGDRATLIRQPFTVDRDADRMGLRLCESLPSARRLPALLSQPVSFGAVQLPPDGCPIILGVDHQTTGGYPLLGVIASIDHGRIAQLRAGARLRFRCVPVEEAQRLWREREERYARWRLGVNWWWREARRE